MKCYCEPQGLCSGKIELYLNHFSLCKYHGELVTKLQTMKLAQLEKLAKSAVWDKNRRAVHGDVVRRLALCSTVAEFHTHAEAAYAGTYDYTQH